MLLFLTINAGQIMAMGLQQEAVTYITQCCYKSLTTADLIVAKQMVKSTNSGCPYCNASPFEVKKQTPPAPVVPVPTATLHPAFITPGTPYSALIPPANLYPESATTSNTTANSSGLMNNHRQAFVVVTNNSAAQQLPSVCRICDEQQDHFAQLSCNHNYYCTGCVTDILSNAIREKTTQAMRCPECKKKFDETELLTFTQTDRKKLQQLMPIIKKELRKQQPGAKECKTNGCNYIHIITSTNAQTIKCPECLQWSCSLCMVNHTPSTTCADAARTRAMGDKNEQEYQKWKSEHTKPCPTCSAAIQKAPGGCPKVECAQCKQAFCYDCLEKTSWSTMHQCQTKTTGTTSSQTQSTNNNTDSDSDSDSDELSNLFNKAIKLFAFKKALEAIEEQFQPPKASLTEGSSTQEQRFKYFIVRFDKQVSESYFNKFLRFMVQLGKGTTKPTIANYKTFSAHGQKVSFSTTMTKTEFQELINLANDSEL